MSCAQAGDGGRVVLGDERFEEYVPVLAGKRVAVFSNQTGIVGDRVKGSKLAEELRRQMPGQAGHDVKSAGHDALLSSPAPTGDPGPSASSGTGVDWSLIPFDEPAKEGGRIEYGPHLVDVLLEKGVDVRVIFSPEHGFRGTADAGEHVDSGRDEKTGVEILSLYGGGSKAFGKESMDKFDVLLVDIQDVGLRYYTYYISMHHLMEACAKHGKKVIILDRPNPNGFYVDGPVLDMEYRSGVGWLPIPTVHGMTLGELALMINGEGWLEGGIKCNLEVVPCLGYSHGMKTALILPPSPNLKDMRAVYLYSSTCYFEGTVVSLGRGTPWPFEVYGHPDIQEYSFSFIPRSIPGAKNPPLLDGECHGEDLRGKPLPEIWDEGIDLEYVVSAYRALNIGEAFFGDGRFFDLLAGVGYVRRMIIEGASAAEVKARWKDDVEAFKARRQPYLLYDE